MIPSVFFLFRGFCFFLLASTDSRGWTVPLGKLARTGCDDHIRGTDLFSSLFSPEYEMEEDPEPPFSYSAEVVGASGKMGSFWLVNHGANEAEKAAAVPKGVSPGYLSPPGSPIYVATPEETWTEIWEKVPLHRRKDCVFFTREYGSSNKPFDEATFVYFVNIDFPKICRRSASGDVVVCTPEEPDPILRAMVYPRLEDGKPFALLQQGENSTTVAGVLEQLGVGTETFLKTIDVDAGYRMLWDSILWLVCHAPLGDDDGPLTIGQAHDKRQDAIDRLWAELLPALVRFLGKGDWVGKKSSSELRIVEKSLQQMANQWVGKDPSSEIRNFVPGKEESLALFETRNGRFLKLATKENPQTFHRELLQKVTDFETMEEIPYFERLVETWRRSVPERAKLDLESIHLAVWGTRDAERAKDPPPKHITIVGGGILGCAMALSLAQTKDPETTIVVLDKALSEEGVGATTPASWAWINANSKHPKSYRDLNRLGIHAWKHEPHLSPLPSWTGSLVRFEEYPDFCDDGDYPAVGPLSAEDVRSLEPFCDWSPVGNNTEGHTFLFSDEGNVDPSTAVRALRKAAKSLGVEFVSGHNVTALVRDPETNKLSGVLCQKLRVDGAGASSFGEDEFIATDLLVSAAGTGVAATCLGGVPLLHRPGQIAYARPTKKKGFRLEATTTVGLRSGISFDTNTLDYEKMRLCLILVDQLRSSHLLQRRDGTLVAGGGALEVGGTSGTIPIGSASESASLLEGARQLSPLLIETATLDKVVSAVRPMPSDGLPVVGFVEQGLYVAVTHSGITLGPLLAALAAGEILQHVDCDLLAPYRPSRFSRDD